MPNVSDLVAQRCHIWHVQGTSVPSHPTYVVWFVAVTRMALLWNVRSALPTPEPAEAQVLSLYHYHTENDRRTPRLQALAGCLRCWRLQEGVQFARPLGIPLPLQTTPTKFVVRTHPTSVLGNANHDHPI